MKTKHTDKIIVTGGSGFIGTNLVEYLIQNNFNFINIDVNPPKNSRHNKYWYKCDIREYDKINDIASRFKATHLINLAADLGMDHKNLDNLQTNIKGIDNLIRLINSQDNMKRVIFVSSLLVCKNGYIPNSDIDYNPPNFYGKSKMLGEIKVRDSNLNCEWVIVRPTSIWGPWFDYSYKEFFMTIDKNRYFHIGRNDFQKPASYVENTVYSMIRLLFYNSIDINKQTYYLADYPWYSTRKWANTIQKVLNSRKIHTAPLWVLKVVAIFGDLLKLTIKFEPPLTSFRLRNMLTGGEYPVSKTRKVVGGLPFNLNQSTYKTAQWMYKNNLIKHRPRENEQKN